MHEAGFRLSPIRWVENIWIPMPDGRRLAARLWLPDDAERNPVPAVIEYLPYRKRDGTRYRDDRMQPYIARHGYAVLRVDIAGTGDSDGVFTDEYTKEEQDDGLAAIAWIAAQPWCSGKVGMMGMSYGGFNSLQIAARRPPALAAIVTICAADDRYADDAHYMGGAVLIENIVWGSAIFAQTALPPDPEIVGERWRGMWFERLEKTPRWVATWLAHQRRDSFWRHGSVAEDYSAIRCPVYAIGGWADAYRNAVPRLIANLSVPAKGLIGPWAHGWPFQSSPGPAIGVLQELIRWWDTWLKDRPTGIMDEPRLRVWMQDAIPRRIDREEQPGRWVAERSWPSPRIHVRAWHVNANRLAAKAEPEEALPLSSPLWVGRAAGSWCPFGSGTDLDGDQRIDDGGSLNFDSAPLTEPMEILGAPILELDLASDKPSALLVARLSDLDPAGGSARVTYGVINLTRRESHEHPAPLEPGWRYRVRLQLNHIAYRFPVGHRVRLALSTAYWPILWPAPAKAVVTVFTGGSVLSLPERPPDEADAGLRPFELPQTEEPPPTTTLTPEAGGSVWRYRIADDAWELETRSDSGFERFEMTQMAVRTRIARNYVIAGDDPLSAKAEMSWTMDRRRGDWAVRVEARIRLSATAEAFRVEHALKAYEGGSEVFARDWDDRIPRDLV